MKIIKVKVKREDGGGCTNYIYPKGYDPQKIDVLAYESVGAESAVMARGKFNYEYCIGVVKDEDLKQFTDSLDIEELSREEAVALGDVWRPQQEVITDEGAVMLVLSKAAKGQSLSKKDRDIIDPTSPISGINLSKKFSDLLDERLEK